VAVVVVASNADVRTVIEICQFPANGKFTPLAV
jgi:hypothetical protein